MADSRARPQRGGVWLAAAIALLAGCAVVPMRPRGEWLSASTPHFEIASGLSAKRTRALAARLERVRGVALAFGGLEATELGVPTRLVLFPRTRNFAALRPHRALSGYFQPTAHANYLAVDADDPAASLQIAQHELAHLLQLGPGHAEAPAWFREGLAELLATAALRGREAEIGAPPPGHLALARAAPLPLARVLGARDVLRWERRALEGFYAQSWALAHYLLLGGGAPSREALRLFVAGLGPAGDAERVCRDALGRPLDQLERELLAYVERDELPRIRVPAPRGESDARIALAPLRDADRDALLADLALSFGERRWRRAETLLRAALAQDPAHPLARATHAWLAAERGEPHADAEIARAEALPARDAETERRIGEAWLARARAEAAPAAQRERLARAEEGFARSLARDPTHAAARLGLARIARARGDGEGARRQLAAAQGALPALPALAVERAREELAAGRKDAARGALASALANPHAAPTPQGERDALASLLRDAGLANDAGGTSHLAARLDVQAPSPGAPTTTDLPFFEVRGKAGLWEAALQDVALALDVSNSTLDASGIDVDGDGRTGRTLGKSLLTPERRGSSDRGDSIVRAEIAAAERLLAELDPLTTRVSLVLFTAEARLAAPLGTPAAALAALREHRVRYDPTGTSFAEALERAFEDLLAHRRPGERSQRTILMLSDGEPTAPSRLEARKRALRVADRLARFGVRVHAFALGEDAPDKSETLRDVAARTGGRFAATVDLRDVSFLRDLRLTGLRGVTIRNLSSAAAARAPRSFADGSFDAIVPLAPGENTIEVRAEIAGRAPLVVTRRVSREPPAPSDSTHRTRAAALRHALRERTQQLASRAQLETERAQRAAEREARRGRALKIEPRDAAAPPPEPASD